MWILVVVLLQGGQIVQGKMVGMESEADCKSTGAAYVERFQAAPEAEVWFECREVKSKQEKPLLKKDRDS